MNIEEILHQQDAFFQTGKTLTYSYRKNALKKLKEAILKNQDILYTSLKQDLGKTETESFMCEIGLILSDINYQMKHLKKQMKPKKKRTPLAQFKGKSYIIPVPYGRVCILSPWNYPVLLTFGPLIGAIAAGNTAIVKPSEYSLATSAAIQTIIKECFLEEEVAVLLGDKNVAAELLAYKFDYIFFTGGTTIGKIVYEAAAKYLTPVTLELGGKSPVIVDSTAKIDLAAKRIVFGKFVNCGQTCVAPDYILVHKSKKEQLIHSLIYWIEKFYPNGLENKDYGKIIHEGHFNRLLGYIDSEEVVYGGNADRSSLKIEPTLLHATLHSKAMQEEIFGPILPILTYETEAELFDIISNHPTPLALYIFSNSKKAIKKYSTQIAFGGGCVNDTIIHLATNELPFGGVGTSGIGSYHGKKSFETFTHYKSILNKATWLDLPIRYAPYTKRKTKFIHFFLK